MHVHHKYIKYNPLQLLTEKHIDEDCNLVVLAPTSSGKTIVAEQFMFPVIDNGQKALYLSPLKALTNEKLADWEKLPYTTVAITGDYQQAQAVTQQLVLMTTESLDSKTRGHKAWLGQVGILVADESHMIGMPGRGDAFEVGVTRFAQNNPNARIVFLSATVPNAGEFGEWLTELNGKPTKVIETDWRPVTQTYHLITAPDKSWAFNRKAVQDCQEIISLHKNGQVIIFVHSHYAGNTIAKALGIPFHNSRLSKEKRAELENKVRQREVRVMVSTSTLAYGVNLPFDVGIIFGAHRGPMDVEAIDLKQMAGRVGRYGLATTADVYFIFKKSHARERMDAVTEIPVVRSVLPRKLYFHITSFVARESMSKTQIIDFVSRTFYGHIARKEAGYEEVIQRQVEEAISILVGYDILRQFKETIYASQLGKAAAVMYVDPIDLWHLKRNLSGNPMSPSLIAKSLANVPSLARETFIPDDLEDPIQMEWGMQTIMATCLREWLFGKELNAIGTSMVPAYAKDMERVFTALSMAGMPKEYTTGLSIMVSNGIPHTLVELIKLPGVGRKRAMSLYNVGIKSKDDLKKRENVAKNVLGQRIYNNVMRSFSSGSTINFYF